MRESVRRRPSRARRARLLLFLACFFWASAAPPAYAAGPEGPERPYLELKSDFEKAVKKAKEPKILGGQALRCAALAWGLAARDLGGQGGGFAGPDKLEDFKRNWAASKSWEKRDLLSLHFYYGALAEFTRERIGDDSKLAGELAQIKAETDKRLKELVAKKHSDGEEKAFLSGAVSTLMTLLIKSVGGSAAEPSIDKVLKDMVRKAESISRRTDVHYQARLSLHYLNNIQTLNRLIFLLGHSSGPPLADEARAVYDNWSKASEKSSPAEALSLSWVAQAQVVIPLAFWLTKTGENQAAMEFVRR